MCVGAGNRVGSQRQWGGTYFCVGITELDGVEQNGVWVRTECPLTDSQCTFLHCYISAFILYVNAYSMLLPPFSDDTYTEDILETVSSQQWQNVGEILPAANFETGEGIPA